MDLLRQGDFFNPMKITDEIHIIGVGAIGSHIAEMLIRMGVEKMHIYDFDTVDEHNIPNQVFYEGDINKTKCAALSTTLYQINSECTITPHTKGYTLGNNTRLSGYVFLCVDSINLRKSIVEEHRYNPMIKGVFDFRMGLESAQHYAANWAIPKSIENFVATMDFTDEEAKAAMPVSACGSSLSVLPTIRAITALGVANWMNFVKNNTLKKVILVDTFKPEIDAFN